MNGENEEGLNILSNSLISRVQNRFATIFMPYLGYLFFSDRVNTNLWRLLGSTVESGSIISRGTFINAPGKLSVGKNSYIHGNLRTRGDVIIGNNVEFVGDVNISTQKHDLSSTLFRNVYNAVVIEDECWLSINAIVLDGVTLAKGTVLAAGCVITRDTEAWGVYGGVPGKKISIRTVVNRDEIENELRKYGNPAS